MRFSLLALLPIAAATVYVTNPTDPTTATGGQTLQVKWIDDGKAPRLADIGVCKVDLCIGTHTTQICLQNLAEKVDVSAATYISTTIDPKAGENGKYYFVKFTSGSAKDAANQPYTQYSAKFTLNSMTGKFTPEQAKLAGEASSTAATAIKVASTSGSPSGSVKTTATASGSGKPSAPSASSKGNGAGSLLAPVGFAIAAGLGGYIAI